MIQDISFKTDNIKFQIERYYSATKKEVIEGTVPLGYEDGQFGPGLRAFSQMLYYQGRVTQNKIEKILAGMGILISDTELSRMVNSIPECFSTDRKEAKHAAVDKAGYLQIDDTGAKILGETGHTFVLCNEYFTDYTTCGSKSRMSVIQALWGTKHPLYRLNRNALADLKGKIAKKYIKELKKLIGHQFYTKDELEKKILRRSPLDELPRKSKEDVITACAIAGYRGTSSVDVLRPSVLVSDDATNFKNIFRLHGACWIHEMRHYSTIDVYSDYHKKLLDDFLDGVWKFYRRLKTYQRSPVVEEKVKLSKIFDELFTSNTGFSRLDEYFPNTLARKDKLLLVLDHPYIPLHNNTSETDLRERVIKRKISYGNRSWQGVKAWDTYLGLLHTCRKLKISFWAYLQDRIYKKFEIPSFRKLIQAI